MNMVTDGCLEPEIWLFWVKAPGNYFLRKKPVTWFYFPLLGKNKCIFFPNFQLYVCGFNFDILSDNLLSTPEKNSLLKSITPPWSHVGYSTLCLNDFSSFLNGLLAFLSFFSLHLLFYWYRFIFLNHFFQPCTCLWKSSAAHLTMDKAQASSRNIYIIHSYNDPLETFTCFIHYSPPIVDWVLWNHHFIGKGWILDIYISIYLHLPNDWLPVCLSPMLH